MKSVSGVAFYVKNLESFIWFPLFLMFRGRIRSDVVVIQNLIQTKNMQFPKW